MALRVCAEPRCPELQPEARCPRHRRQREQQRGTRQQRGYDAQHDRLRAAYQSRMDHGQTFDCWRCGKPIDPSSWHLGHDDHDRARYQGPECPPCNLATASRRTSPDA